MVLAFWQRSIDISAMCLLFVGSVVVNKIVLSAVIASATLATAAAGTAISTRSGLLFQAS